MKDEEDRVEEYLSLLAEDKVLNRLDAMLGRRAPNALIQEFLTKLDLPDGSTEYRWKGKAFIIVEGFDVDDEEVRVVTRDP